MQIVVICIVCCVGRVLCHRDDNCVVHNFAVETG